MSDAKRPTCFVIGPISTPGSEIRQHADMFLNVLVRHVLEERGGGFLVKRSDEDPDPGMITDRMILDIINSELVIADLSELNPNAFYELGIRHAAKKPVIHLAKEGTQIPFDNAQHRAIFFDLSVWEKLKHARQNLARAVQEVTKDGYRVSNPVTHAIATFEIQMSGDSKDKVISDLIASVQEIRRKVDRVDEDGNAIYQRGQKNKEIEVKNWVYVTKLLGRVQSEYERVAFDNDGNFNLHKIIDHIRSILLENDVSIEGIEMRSDSARMYVNRGYVIGIFPSGLNY